MRFIGRREGVGEQLVRADGLGRSADRRQQPDHAVRRLQLRRARRDPRRRARASTGGTEEEFRRCLYAPEMHDPDLIIRTSGERRLSNYLLWQSAYSELSSATSCGRTSRARRSSSRWPSSPSAAAASADADGTPRLRRRLDDATPVAPPRRRPRAHAGRGGPRSDLSARLLAAVPAIALRAVPRDRGRLVFALGLFVLGCVCMHELYGMYDARAPGAPRGLHRARRACSRRRCTAASSRSCSSRSRRCRCCSR